MPNLLGYGPGVSIIDARIAPTADGWRLDRALADAVPTLSRERLKVLINSGAVTRDGVMARDPAKRATGGDLFQVAVPAPCPRITKRRIFRSSSPMRTNI